MRHSDLESIKLIPYITHPDYLTLPFGRYIKRKLQRFAKSHVDFKPHDSWLVSDMMKDCVAGGCGVHNRSRKYR